MQSITSVLRRLSGRTSAASAVFGVSLDVEEAIGMWGAALDGGLPALELGALLAVLAASGETPEELLGLHYALEMRSARFRPDVSRRAVSIPVYGLVPGEASLAVLLALFLRRFDVPVILHGTLDCPAGPSAPALLREFGVLPSATLAHAESELRDSGVAFVPAQLLSPGLAVLLALRTRLGTTNAAHLAACAMDPGAMGAVRLAPGCVGARSDHLAPMLAATGGEILRLTWPAGVRSAALSCQPKVRFISGGVETTLFESDGAARAGDGRQIPVVEMVAWMQSVVDRRAPAPSALVGIAAAAIYAAGAAADFTQAKAIVALQSGRLAA